MNRVASAAADADEGYRDTYKPHLGVFTKAGMDATLMPVGKIDRVMIVKTDHTQVVISDNGRPLPTSSAEVKRFVIADEEGRSTIIPGTATPDELVAAVTNLVSQEPKPVQVAPAS